MTHDSPLHPDDRPDPADHARWREIDSVTPPPPPVADEAAVLLELAAYVDGRLDDDARAALEARLSADARLRDLVLDAATHRDDTPASLAGPAVVARAAALVPSTASRPEVVGAIWVRAARWTVAAAACIGVGVIGWQIGVGAGTATTPGGTQVADGGDEPTIMFPYDLIDPATPGDASAADDTDDLLLFALGVSSATISGSVTP